MTLLLTPRAALLDEPKVEATLHVERKDLSFTSRHPDVVDISVVVTNIGDIPSSPAHALLSAAPLGAFVRWRPLAVVPVAGLQPGETYVASAKVSRPKRQPLGTPDRVPPDKLLTALGADDEGPNRRGRRLMHSVTDLLRTPWYRPSGQSTLGELPADPMELLSRANRHWAGNLNIFIGGQAVERHMAQALRVYPGQLNMAMFIVGCGHDAYQFDLKGEAVAWEARLFDFMRAHSFVMRPREGCAVPLGQWVELQTQSMMLLAIEPPASCSRGSLDVHVKQRSTGKNAVVEFSLDPNAAGPGCYTV